MLFKLFCSLTKNRETLLPAYTKMELILEKWSEQIQSSWFDPVLVDYLEVDSQVNKQSLSNLSYTIINICIRLK